MQFFLYLMLETIVAEIISMEYGHWIIWETLMNALKMMRFSVLLTVYHKKLLM